MSAFEDAARAEAERRHPAPEIETGDELGYTRTQIREVVRRAHVEGWKAARDHLAEQEPSDAEVLAALNADYALRFGSRSLPADSLEPYGDETVQIMREALRAAAAVRGRG